MSLKYLITSERMEVFKKIIEEYQKYGSQLGGVSLS